MLGVVAVLLCSVDPYPIDDDAHIFVWACF